MIDYRVDHDGIAIVTNPDLKVGCLKVDQLNQLWKKGYAIPRLGRS